MPYRRVTYLEQIWYLLRYKILELLRREEENHDREAIEARDR